MPNSWIVLLADNDTVPVSIEPTGRGDGFDARRAEDAARHIIAPRTDVFAAKPAGCTGMAWNVHFGAENACPVHGEG